MLIVYYQKKMLQFFVSFFDQKRREYTAFLGIKSIFKGF